MDPIRIVFNSDTATWFIQQKVTRYIPQSSSAINYVPDVVEEGWEDRSEHDNFYLAVIELLELSIAEGSEGPEGVPLQIDSIDLGPISPNSNLVTAIRQGLAGLTL